MIDRRFKEARETEKRMQSYQPVLDTLMERYGIADGDAKRLLEAVDNAVPAPVITSSLFARFSSRQPNSPAMRALAALRQQFGGHAVLPSDD